MWTMLFATGATRVCSRFYTGQPVANLAVLFAGRSVDLDRRRRYIGGLYWSTNLMPRRVHFFPPPLLCKSEPSMCRKLRDMGGIQEMLASPGSLFQIKSPPTKNTVLNFNGVQCKALILKTNSTCFTGHAQPRLTSSFMSRHMFTPVAAKWRPFGKEGIWYFPLRKTRRHIAAFTLPHSKMAPSLPPGRLVGSLFWFLVVIMFS